MTEEDYRKEAAFIQAEIEFKENFELEMEFTQKPFRIFYTMTLIWLLQQPT